MHPCGGMLRRGKKARSCPTFPPPHPCHTPASELATRLDALDLEESWTEDRAVTWWEQHRPVPLDN
jgi:hypothetical protein